MLLSRIDALYARIIGPDTRHYHGSQNKAEFQVCIDHLDRCIQTIAEPEIRFLEIGAYKGLWALGLQVLCEANGKTPRYATATWLGQDPNNRDLLRTGEHFRAAGYPFSLVDGDSTLPQTVAAVRALSPSHHFVLIDGDHRLPAVLADIRNYGPMASHRLLFHDINTRSCGVRKAVVRAGVFLNIEIAYGADMGIGIHDCTVAPPVRKRRFWQR